MFFCFVVLICGTQLMWAGCVTTNDFTLIKGAGNNTYILSSYVDNFDSAKQVCDSVGAFMPLFDTNLEYESVYGYLNEYHSPQEVWVEIKTVTDYKKINYFWQTEEISSSLWGPYDPNGNCAVKGQSSCCGVMRTDQSLAGGSVSGELIDSDEACHLRDCSFLCVVPDSVSMLGDECQSSKDNDCSHICTDLFLGYTCSCPDGLQLDTDGKTCIDIDECVHSSPNPCDQGCVNEVGSYTCECYLGYQIDTMNDRCNDIDECSELSSGCDQQCTNTDGSYQCSCSDGFSLSSDNHTCIDINECTTGLHNCQQICTNTNGSYLCSCHDGYTVNPENTSECQNINECDLNPCEHICTDSEGSFSCQCNPGFRLQGDARSCEDIDECLELLHSCSQICTNTQGGFTCACMAGYQGNGVVCEDIDECLEADLNPCEQLCQNTEGSFSCSCESGYRLVSPTECNDVDECVDGSNTCEQACENTAGSYICSCGAGFIKVNFSHCEDIDECQNGNNSCEQICNNTRGSYICSCEPGFALNSDGHNCTDIDECSGHSTNNQSSLCDQICVNTAGSYHCSCYSGYQMINTASCVRQSSMCFCTCPDSVLQLNTAHRDSKYIAQELALDRKSLSSYSRRLQSAHDSRVTSQVVGYLGVVVILLCIGVLFLCDMSNLKRIFRSQRGQRNYYGS